MFWKDNDANALYNRIIQLRTQYGYTPTPEIITDICTNEILGGFKKFKTKSIISEYPDDFVRKMRMTGLISFRGGGRFIDINHKEDSTIDYIINKYSKYQKYNSEQEYFNYMSTVDKHLFVYNETQINRNEASKKLTVTTNYPKRV